MKKFDTINALFFGSCGLGLSAPLRLSGVLVVLISSSVLPTDGDGAPLELTLAARARFSSRPFAGPLDDFLSLIGSFEVCGSIFESVGKLRVKRSSVQVTRLPLHIEDAQSATHYHPTVHTYLFEC